MFEGAVSYEGVVIRPPSEAGSLILQATLGCSDNGCIFCPAYKEKQFRIKDFAVFEREVSAAAKVMPDIRRVFLADGDALAIPAAGFLKILDLLSEKFKALSRVSAYGSVKSLENKTLAELREFKARKLGTVYLGFETGDEKVYRLINKYGSPGGNVETCLKVKEAGLTANVTVILGLGGKALSEAHGVNTARVLTLAAPSQVAALTLMIEPGTPLHDLRASGEFREIDEFEILSEQKIMLENMGDFRCQYFSNHASNFLPVAARFPKDKAAVIDALNQILLSRNKSGLTPDFMRCL